MNKSQSLTLSALLFFAVGKRRRTRGHNLVRQHDALAGNRQGDLRDQHDATSPETRIVRYGDVRLKRRADDADLLRYNLQH